MGAVGKCSSMAHPILFSKKYTLEISYFKRNLFRVPLSHYSRIDLNPVHSPKKRTLGFKPFLGKSNKQNPESIDYQGNLCCFRVVPHLSQLFGLFKKWRNFFSPCGWLRASGELTYMSGLLSTQLCPPFTSFGCSTTY